MFNTFFVYSNQINSKGTMQELYGDCIAYDKHNNILYNKSITRVDRNGGSTYELDFMTNHDVKKIYKVELVFYDDYGNELYHNSTTKIKTNKDIETGVQDPDEYYK